MARAREIHAAAGTPWEDLSKPERAWYVRVSKLVRLADELDEIVREEEDK